MLTNANQSIFLQASKRQDYCYLQAPLLSVCMYSQTGDMLQLSEYRKAICVWVAGYPHNKPISSYSSHLIAKIFWPKYSA